jgi:hypothetical protein
VTIEFGELEREVGGVMSMDRVHVEWMAAVLAVLKPRTVIEIGCYAGVSTMAVATAYDRRHIYEAHLIDILIQPTVIAIAEGRERITLHQRPSTQALPEIAVLEDLVVLIDGDHSLACVSQELPAVLDKAPRAIIAHDVTAEAAGYGQCDGSRWLWEALQREGWLCLVDCRRRPNASTHRGLLVACRDAGDFALAQEAMRRTCDG